jgi:GMP synthase-like glutamine amidotransferase
MKRNKNLDQLFKERFKEKKVLNVLCSTKYSKDFDWHNDYVANYVTKVEDADLVVFTGGSDVDPSYYNEPKGRYTGSGGVRDVFEMSLFQAALEANIPMFGICRGHQLICAALGGTLIQHVQHHSGHTVKTYDGLAFAANSYHHQMIRPKGITDKYKVLGWVNNGSPYHLDGNNEQIVFDENETPEIEVIAYPELNIMSIQGHPEWQEPGAYNNWLSEQFNKFITISKNERDTSTTTI